MKTLTIAQIDWLKFALVQHEGWRGNHNPDEYDEFDEWTDAIRQAVKDVERDRKRLRAALDYIAKSPCAPDITHEQKAAWDKLQKLEAKVQT